MDSTTMYGTTVDLGEGWGGTAEGTEIEGVVRVQRKGETGVMGEPHTSDLYVVGFTATIQADSAKQAGERAMHLRAWLVDQPWLRENNPDYEPDFEWHLHDHDGC